VHVLRSKSAVLCLPAAGAAAGAAAAADLLAAVFQHAGVQSGQLLVMQLPVVTLLAGPGLLLGLRLLPMLSLLRLLPMTCSQEQQ
jgi:hypothetical protein